MAGGQTPLVYIENGLFRPCLPVLSPKAVASRSLYRINSSTDAIHQCKMNVNVVGLLSLFKGCHGSILVFLKKIVTIWITSPEDNSDEWLS